MLDKRLNDKGKNWRHVWKVLIVHYLAFHYSSSGFIQSLTVLGYCLHHGSENSVINFRENIYVVKTLDEFQYIDEDGKDQGANVRQKAKDITNLLQDESRLRERRARAHMGDRLIRGTSDDPGEFEDENRSRRSDSSSNPSTRPNRDEEDLRKAIEESKKSLAEERVTAGQRDPRDLRKAIEESKKSLAEERVTAGQRDPRDPELELAIQMIQKEEDQRKKQVADSASTLFDDTNQPSYVSFLLLSYQ